MSFTHNNSKGTTYHLNKKDVTLKSTGKYKLSTISQKILDLQHVISLMDTMLKRIQELDYHS